LQYSFTDAKLLKVGDGSGKASILNAPRAFKDVKPTALMDLKYVMVPMAKNKVMIRVQNLNDEFDGVTEPLTFDV
jgi:hypothetical protein